MKIKHNGIVIRGRGIDPLAGNACDRHGAKFTFWKSGLKRGSRPSYQLGEALPQDFGRSAGPKKKSRIDEDCGIKDFGLPASHGPLISIPTGPAEMKTPKEGRRGSTRMNRAPLLAPLKPLSPTSSAP